MVLFSYNSNMGSIHNNIYLAKQVRELDRIAIKDLQIPGFTLMQRAGAAAFEAIQQIWPTAKQIIVLAGTGNNGGDGYIIASLALSAKLTVAVLQVGDHSKLHGDAKKAHDVYVDNGGQCKVFNEKSLPECDVIVDALLGTGLSREVKHPFDIAIELTNKHQGGVLSVDIASGLDADHGIPLGNAVIADATVTFVGMKLGIFTAAGRKHSGKVIFNNLQIPNEAYQSMTPTCTTINLDEFHEILGKRLEDAHKGNFGHVLVIGGNEGMAGSVMLCAEAAARTGSGLVSVATLKQHASIAIQSCREMMVHGVDGIEQLQPLLEKASVIAVGPGLGQNAWAKNIFAKVLELNAPMVLDADALNLLAEEPLHKFSWILTPHPGEAARLLNITTREIQKDRLEAVRAIQRKYGGVCVLKGSGTLVANTNQTSICTAGNPGMASGGMGDVLTGIIVGLIAQGLNLYDAARFGVELHAQSADLAAEDGMRGMLASDLFVPLRKLVNDSCI